MKISIGKNNWDVETYGSKLEKDVVNSPALNYLFLQDDDFMM